MKNISYRISNHGTHADDVVYEAATPQKVLIIGASGYLGSALCLGLRDHYNVVGTYNQRPFRLEGCLSTQADALDATELLTVISKHNPDIVIYCAGITKHHQCETSPDFADALNAKILGLIFKVLPKTTPLIYLSCDQVLAVKPKVEKLLAEDVEENEKSSPHKNSNDSTKVAVANNEAHHIESNEQFFFKEKDLVNSINVLGESKIRGERLVLEHPHLTWVLRLPLIYGDVLGSPYAPRLSWLRTLQEQIEKEETVTVPNDQIRSTLYVGDFVRAVRSLLKNLPKNSALFHLSANDTVTPYELAMEHLKNVGLSTEFIKGVSLQEHLDELQQSHTEPLETPMSSEKFCRRYDFKFQSAIDGLKEYKQRLAEGYCGDWL